MFTMFPTLDLLDKYFTFIRPGSLVSKYNTAEECVLLHLEKGAFLSGLYSFLFSTKALKYIM